MKTMRMRMVSGIATLVVVASVERAGAWGVSYYNNMAASTGYSLNGSVQLPSGTGHLIVETAGGAGDCDIYVRLGATPTLSAYTQRSAKSGNRELVDIVNPSAGRYYIMLYAYSGFSGLKTELVTTPQAANWRSDMLNRVNYERQWFGVSTLAVDSRLQNAAQKFAADMAANSYLGGADGHTGRDGSTVSNRIWREGYYPTTWGENMAYGQTSVAQFMNSWLNSPGHWSNIMKADYRKVGFGAAVNQADSTGYKTRCVQDFGAP